MPGKKKLTDLTGDGKITRKDFLRGAGVPGFEHGGKVHRDPGQVEREMEAEAKEREKDEKFIKEVLMPKEKDVVKKAYGGMVKPKYNKGGKVEGYAGGGMVRGCKGLQVSGKGFKGVF